MNQFSMIKWTNQGIIILTWLAENFGLKKSSVYANIKYNRRTIALARLYKEETNQITYNESKISFFSNVPY